jgi:hypothetical protein
MLVPLLRIIKLLLLSIAYSLSLFHPMAYAKDNGSLEFKIAVVAPYDIRQEWFWALRGGGVNVAPGFLHQLKSQLEGLSLLVLDSMPLSSGDAEDIYNWVSNGGILIYSGSASALQTPSNQNDVTHDLNVAFPELFGVDFDGIDPGQINYYPHLVKSSSLLSPLIAGDGIRFGRIGIGHTYRFKERVGSEVIARSSRLSLGNDSFLITKDNPTII